MTILSHKERPGGMLGISGLITDYISSTFIQEAILNLQKDLERICNKNKKCGCKIKTHREACKLGYMALHADEVSSTDNN